MLGVVGAVIPVIICIEGVNRVFSEAVGDEEVVNVVFKIKVVKI